jgi:hypothetical protein
VEPAKPKKASQFNISLCGKVFMQLVRPILDSDIKRLEAKFSHEYCTCTNFFYVSLCIEHREEAMMTVEELE